MATRLTVYLTLCLAVMLVAVASGCGRRAQPIPEEMTSRSDVPQTEAWDVVYDLTEGGTRRASIDAGYMARYESKDSTIVVLRANESGGSLAVDIFGPAGARTATLFAREVRLNEQARTFTAEGDVVVITDDGKRLETESLVWSEAGREIRTSGFVRITSETESLEGYELRADEDLSAYEINRLTGSAVFEEN